MGIFLHASLVTFTNWNAFQNSFNHVFLFSYTLHENLFVVMFIYVWTFLLLHIEIAVNHFVKYSYLEIRIIKQESLCKFFYFVYKIWTMKKLPELPCFSYRFKRILKRILTNIKSIKIIKLGFFTVLMTSWSVIKKYKLLELARFVDWYWSLSNWCLAHYYSGTIEIGLILVWIIPYNNII